MTNHKHYDLIGPALDWAVATCEGLNVEDFQDGECWVRDDKFSPPHTYQPSIHWAQVRLAEKSKAILNTMERIMK
jgi:hypothetical protein